MRLHSSMFLFFFLILILLEVEKKKEKILIILSLFSEITRSVHESTEKEINLID